MFQTSPTILPQSKTWRELTTLVSCYVGLASVNDEETEEMKQLRRQIVSFKYEALRLLSQQLAAERKWVEKADHLVISIVHQLAGELDMLDQAQYREILANLSAALVLRPKRLLDQEYIRPLMKSMLALDQFLGRDQLVCRLCADVEDGKLTKENRLQLVLMLDRLALQ